MKIVKIILIINLIIFQSNLVMAENSKNFSNENDIIEYQQEIKKNSLIIDNYHMLGLIFQESKEYNKAIEQFNKVFSIPQNKALTYDPKNWKVKNNPEIKNRIYFSSRYMIGYCYYAMNNFEEAINELTRAIKEYPIILKNYYDGGLFYYILGRSYYKLKDYKNAQINYQKGLKYHDSHGDIYNGLAYIYLAQNQKKEALEIFEKNIKLNPNYSNGYDSLAEYYLNEGNNEKAKFYYNKGCELGKESSCEKFKQLVN